MDRPTQNIRPLKQAMPANASQSRDDHGARVVMRFELGEEFVGYLSESVRNLVSYYTTFAFQGKRLAVMLCSVRNYLHDGGL